MLLLITFMIITGFVSNCMAALSLGGGYLDNDERMILYTHINRGFSSEADKGVDPDILLNRQAERMMNKVLLPYYEEDKKEAFLLGFLSANGVSKVRSDVLLLMVSESENQKTFLECTCQFEERLARILDVMAKRDDIWSNAILFLCYYAGKNKVLESPDLSTDLFRSFDKYAFIDSVNALNQPYIIAINPDNKFLYHHLGSIVNVSVITLLALYMLYVYFH